MPERDLEVVREIYAHWARGDWRYGTHLWADDVVVTTFDADGDEIVLHGLQDFRSWFRSFLQHWDDLRQDVDELIEHDGRILAIGSQSATGKTSGVRLEMPIYNVWRLDERGRIVEFHTTRHEEMARRAAGLDAR